MFALARPTILLFLLISCSPKKNIGPQASSGKAIVDGPAPSSIDENLKDTTKCPKLKLLNPSGDAEPLFTLTQPNACDPNTTVGAATAQSSLKNLGLVVHGTQTYAIVEIQSDKGQGYQKGCVRVQSVQCGSTSNLASAGNTAQQTLAQNKSPQSISAAETSASDSVPNTPAKLAPSNVRPLQLECTVTPPLYGSSEKCFAAFKGQKSASDKPLNATWEETSIRDDIVLVTLKKGDKVCADPMLIKQGSFVPLWLFQAHYLHDKNCLVETKSLTCVPGKCAWIF
jgi:hypothetical protein